MITGYILIGRDYRIALFIVLLSLGVGLTAPVYALDPQKSINQYGHSIWTRQNGLPVSAVNTILQSRNGYIWLGTTGGLYHFDGNNFKGVSCSPGTRNIRMTILSMLELRDSSLWIGTVYSGLLHLKNGEPTVHDLKNGFFDTQVRALLQSRRGNLWIGTSIGLFLFAGGKFEPVMLNPNYITGLAEDSAGRIWVGTHEGVKVFNDSDPTTIRSLEIEAKLYDTPTTTVYADRHSNIWIGTYGGLSVWKNGVLRQYTMTDGLTGNFINTVYADRDDNIWVGTPAGLSRLSGKTWSKYTKIDGLSDDNVLAITEDREGSLWVGTSDGLNQFKDVSLTTFTRYDGLADDPISAIHETKDGSIYFFSTNGPSITRRTPSGKFVVHGSWVGPTYVANDGSLWMGQTGMLLNIRGDRITQYGARNGIPQKWISAIAEDDKSLILYIDHVGIFRFVGGRLTPYAMKRGPSHPASEYIVCFYHQRKNLLWIGTAEWLAKIENGEYSRYTTADGICGNWISSFYDDHRGNLWISSTQGGITRYRDGRFTSYTVKNGLFTDEIYCVIGDDGGNLWLSSPRGIGRVRTSDLDDVDAGKTKTFQTQVFTTADGMKTDECFGDWQAAGSRFHDGSIWFATKRGAVRIVPTTFQINTLPPPVLIEQVVVDQRTFDPNRPGTFAPGSDRFEFQYTALSLLAPEKVRFKYVLQGYDKGWIDAGSRRVAYYTNLPPGSYTFKVMGCNNDGLWNETGAGYTFTLEPHFYETAWFIAFMIVAFGILVFGLIRLRLWQMMKNEKELQNRIQEALANIKTLSGLVPICANCKKIRDDQGYWDQLDEYVQSHSSVTFSHSICPDCAEKLYPGILLKPQKIKEKNSSDKT